MRMTKCESSFMHMSEGRFILVAARYARVMGEQLKRDDRKKRCQVETGLRYPDDIICAVRNGPVAFSRDCENHSVTGLQSLNIRQNLPITVVLRCQDHNGGLPVYKGHWAVPDFGGRIRLRRNRRELPELERSLERDWK